MHAGLEFKRGQIEDLTLSDSLFLVTVFPLTVKYPSDDSVSDVCGCHAVKQEQNRFSALPLPSE